MLARTVICARGGQSASPPKRPSVKEVVKHSDHTQGFEDGVQVLWYGDEEGDKVKSHHGEKG